MAHTGIERAWTRIRDAYVRRVPESWTYRICAAVAVAATLVIGLARLASVA